MNGLRVRIWTTVLVLAASLSACSVVSGADAPPAAVEQPPQVVIDPGASESFAATAAPEFATGDDASAAADAASAEADEALEIELDERQTSFPDPLEPLNRRTLSLNQSVDRWVVSPVAV